MTIVLLNRKMPPKKSFDESKPTKISKENYEKLEDENKKLKMQCALFREKFDYQKVQTELNTSDFQAMLSDENRRLNQRVKELESAIKNNYVKTPEESRVRTIRGADHGMETQLKEATDMKSNLEKQLKEATEMVKQIEYQMFKKKEDTLKSEVDALRNREDFLKRKEDALKKREETLKSTEDVQKKKGDELTKLEAGLMNKEKEVNGRETQLKINEDDIKVKMDQLEFKSETLILTEIKQQEKEKSKATTNNTIDAPTKAEFQNLEKLLKAKDSEIVKLIKQLNGKERDVADLQAKLRLSNVVGAQSADVNPDIADLSDINRPTKLAERYCELYDNEWTDAYEEIEESGLKEVEAIKRLLETLKNVYKFCQDVSKDYENRIKTSALVIPRSDQGRPKTPNLTAASRRLIVELRRTIAPTLTDDVFKQYLKSLKQPLDKSPKTKLFVRTCVEICWLMSIQDPPVILDTRDLKGPFDGDTYRTYTRSGKTFDYIVWPPIRLGEAGVLLGKGVAQAK